MAATVVTYDGLKKQISTGKLAPVYILHGREGYYIDMLVKEFEEFLPEADREFNQYVLYAPQTEPGVIMDIASRYPMMADRQMVIVKEAQAVRADQINKLARYVSNPSKSTVLVIVFRGEEAKGKDLISAAKTNGVIFESKKVQDYMIPRLITQAIKDKGLNPDPKAVAMLHDFIGSDLSTLYNQIDKLALILPSAATVTPEVVELNVGISKEYNNFELVEALAVKDVAKCFRIANYFASNPKANPVIVTTTVLYNYFSDLLVAFYSPDKTDAGLMKALNIKWDKQLAKFRNGLRSYNPFQIIEAIWALRKFDCQSKGNGSRQDPNLLFRDLIFHLLSAPGDLGLNKQDPII